MPTRKEDNDDERQARIDAMVEEHQKQLERFNQAKVLSHRAQAHARIARALAVESRLFREQGRRTRKRA
jgi:hypothetical protein